MSSWSTWGPPHGAVFEAEGWGQAPLTVEEIRLALTHLGVLSLIDPVETNPADPRELRRQMHRVWIPFYQS